MAMITVEAERTIFGTCKNGHVLDDANLWWEARPDGASYPRCRTCRRESVQRVRARQRGDDVPSMRIPKAGPRRLQAPHPTPRPAPAERQRSPAPAAAATTSIFSRLDPAMRTRLAGVVMGARGAPRTLRALRVASEKMIWRGMSGDMAFAAYVEALVDASRDSTHPDLRLDVLLAVLLRDD